jgi:hypothetical protein
MRIWTLHPRYLDRRGLVAVWREGLLAQQVLRGRTRGYRRHPQLIRFQAQGSPLGSIAAYLRAVHAEATARGYVFAEEKIGRARAGGRIPVTWGQLDYEWGHLRRKLARRDRVWLSRVGRRSPRPHPLFRVVPGPVEAWERVAR